MIEVGDKVARYLHWDIKHVRLGTVENALFVEGGIYYWVRWIDGSLSTGQASCYRKLTQEEWVAFMLVRE